MAICYFYFFLCLFFCIIFRRCKDKDCKTIGNLICVDCLYGNPFKVYCLDCEDFLVPHAESESETSAEAAASSSKATGAVTVASKASRNTSKKRTKAQTYEPSDSDADSSLPAVAEAAASSSKATGAVTVATESSVPVIISAAE